VGGGLGFLLCIPGSGFGGSLLEEMEMAGYICICARAWIECVRKHASDDWNEE